MPAVMLPRLVSEKLDDLALSVRRLRLWRGLSLWIVATLAVAGLALLADRFGQFGPAGRGLLLAACIAFSALAGWWFVLRPRRSSPSATELAAAIEERFPSLSERLMTVVELSEAKDAHGSKALMDLLARDIAHRTKRLDFERAAPTATAMRGMLLAGAAIGLALAVLFSVSGAAERLRRLVMPWWSPKVEVPFTVRCSSGSVGVKRGESVTLTAYLEKKKPEAVLPDSASLIVKEADGSEKRFPMAAAESAAFHLTRPNVKESFDYRVQAGDQTSDWHKVTVSDGVELIEGTAITIVPPTYTGKNEESQPGFNSLTAIQHAELIAKLKFDRPAEAVTLDWLPAGSAKIASVRLPLSLAADRLSAMASLPLIESGTLRLSVSGGRGAGSSFVAAVKVIPDLPPRFEKAVGIVEKDRRVQPGETILLEAVAADDVNVDWLGVEYSINAQPPVTVPFPMKEITPGKAEGRHAFVLAGLVKDGDVLKYRLKAVDNRKLEKWKLAPQAVYYPEAKWSTLAITNDAEALDRQDVLAQQEALAKKLAEAKQRLHSARKTVDDLERELGPKPMLNTGEVARLQKARDDAEKAKRALAEAAEEAALTPELRGMTEAMRGVNREQIKPADTQLARAGHEGDLAARNGQLREAEKHLKAARELVEELESRNAEIAKNRLAQRQFRKLASEVRNLAAEAEKAATPEERAVLQRKLEEKQAELKELIRNNENLRQGAENATGDEARKLADEAKRLEDAQRELNDAIERDHAAARAKALAGSAAQQDEAAAAADALRKKTEAAMKRAGEEPLAKDPFDKAADDLKKGDAVSAMTEQEKATRELDRLAEQLDRTAAARREPREATKQLGQLQKQLREEFQKAAQAKMTPEEVEKFQTRQKAIEQALDNIETPANDTQSARDKALALDRMRKAREAMADDGAQVAAEQKAAEEELEKLAKDLPSLEERLKASRQELERLTREQADLRQRAEAKLKAFEKRKPDEFTRREIAKAMGDLAAKEKELAEKLDALDAPGFEERRNATAQAARRAAEDIKEGRPQDIPASQNDLKRRMGQLQSALEGRQPNDALADELAKKQDRIAERLAKGDPDAAKLAELQKLQREVADKLGGLNDPDAAERLTRAKQSATEAAKQYQNGDDVDELRNKAKQAAKDLNDLADQLAGVEGDAEKFERLAKQRAERAEWSKANAGKATPPEAAAAMAGELDREMEDLKGGRAGDAQQEKKAAADALEKLRRTPNAERAPRLQQEAADALDQLAKKAKGRSDQAAKKPQDGDSSGDANGQLASKADAEAARKLAEQMRDLKERTAKKGANAKPETKDAEAKAEEQKKLEKQAEELAKKLDQASHASTNGAAEAGKLTKAAEAAKEAAAQMEKAGREEQAGRSRGAAEAREQASKNLGEARESAKAAARPSDAKGAEAGKSAEEAGGQLRAAAQQPGKEAEPLKKAAEKLDEAADRLQPGGNDGTGPKPITETELPPDLKEYAGKPWGDLPGEMKAKIVSDLKAKYGEDYARVIKLYFEQLAESK